MVRKWQCSFLLASSHHHPYMNFYFVVWAIALHGMYELALVIISILKQKNLYIVGCVQCDIWDITAYLLLPKLKYYYGAIHLVITTFGQWLCSGDIKIETLLNFIPLKILKLFP